MENTENNELVDLSYVEELAGDKPDYIYQVLSIFMDNTPKGLKELENLMNKKRRNWDAISKQAHFLKSSVGIVKIKGAHEHFQQIESLSRELKDIKVIKPILDEVVETFKMAEEIINNKMAALAPKENPE